MKRMLCVLLVLVVSCFFTSHAQAQAPTPPKIGQPYTVEYYYKVQWGHADEFLRLFKKNHYPLLKKELEAGRIISITIQQPQYHMPEQQRWDYRVTLVYRDAVTGNAENPDEQKLIQTLFPDQDTFRKEEQRRFEILEAHWDLPVTRLDPLR